MYQYESEEKKKGGSRFKIPHTPVNVLGMHSTQL
jgi:hypothetical protein